MLLTTFNFVHGWHVNDTNTKRSKYFQKYIIANITIHISTITIPSKIIDRCLNMLQFVLYFETLDSIANKMLPIHSKPSDYNEGWWFRKNSIRGRAENFFVPLRGGYSSRELYGLVIFINFENIKQENC